MTTKNQEATIEILNRVILVRIAPSEVHGVGVFAIRDIPKGTRMRMDDVPQVYYLSYGNFSKLFPEVKELIVSRWPRVVNNEPFAYPDARYQAYTNHSDKANYDAQHDVALVDIKKGDEIFEDYRLIKGFETAYPWLVDNKEK